MTAEQNKALDTWQLTVPDASAQRSQYFTQMRTDGYINKAGDLLEFWVAQNVDQANDHWIVMHYTLRDTDFLAEPFTRDKFGEAVPVSYGEAVSRLAEQDKFVRESAIFTRADMQQPEYSAENNRTLKQAYHAVENFHHACHIEGWVFDTLGRPHRRVENMIFTKAKFALQELDAAADAFDADTVDPDASLRMSAGILRPLFNQVAGVVTSLDNKMKIYQTMAGLDRFADQYAAFYLSVQELVGNEDGLSKISGLSEAEAAKVAEAARKLRNDDVYDLVESMYATLDTIKKETGFKFEPYMVTAMECEVYYSLLLAAQGHKGVRASLKIIGGIDEGKIVEVKKYVELATKALERLGGGPTEIEKLKNWVAQPGKDLIHPEIPAFLNRHYISRDGLLKKMGIQQVKVGDVVVAADRVYTGVQPKA